MKVAKAKNQNFLLVYHIGPKNGNEKPPKNPAKVLQKHGKLRENFRKEGNLLFLGPFL